MMENSFGGWQSEIHKDSEQQKRINSAKMLESSKFVIDRNSCTGDYRGTGKNPYHVSLSSCTCVDFSRRKLPCKHIYRLASECGMFDLVTIPVSQKLLSDSVTPVSPTFLDSSVRLLARIYALCAKNTYTCTEPFHNYYRMWPVSQELRWLMSNHFVFDASDLSHDDAFIFDKYRSVITSMTKKELCALLDENGINYPELSKVLLQQFVLDDVSLCEKIFLPVHV